MLKSWIDQWAHPTIIAGVEVYSHPEGERLNYTVLERQKDEINIIDQGSDIPSWSILQERLDTEIPVVLNYNVKTVLHRVLDQPIQNLSAAFRQMLPNTQIQDFAIQAENNAIAFTRKVQLEAYVKQVQEQGFQVLDCRLGVLSVGPLFQLLENYPAIITSSYIIKKEKNQFKKITLNQEAASQQLIIANQAIKGNQCASFSGAFLTLRQYSPAISNHLIQSQQDWTFRQLFQPLKWVVLGSLLIFAASSYWLWQKNQSKVGQLQAYLNYHSSTLSKIDTPCRFPN